MRDLIDLVNILNEARALSANELKKYPEYFEMPVIGKVEKFQRLADAGGGKAKAATYADTDLVGFALEEKTTTTHDPIQIFRYPRFEALISAILEGEPLDLVDGTTAVIDPDEADRLEGLIQTDDLKGTINLKSVSGEEIPLSKLAKTARFGGQAVGGKEGGDLGKESVLVKPTQINITDGDIPASRLGEAIINNEVLLSTDYGKTVIEMAKEIMQGQNPTLPKEYSSKIEKAIVDYAGEYLGVLALVEGVSSFDRKAEFETWLGGDISDLIINFPSKANMNIADSFAVISNKETNHTVNISSKGTGGGAPPSLSGLKIPDEIKDDPNLEAAVQFIELCQDKSPLPTPRSISSIFAGMNLLNEYVPDAIPNNFKQFLPWDIEAITEQVNESIKNFKQLGGAETLPKKYNKLWDEGDFTSASSAGGKLAYVTKKAVMEAVNEKNALPGFRDAILIILDMNFVQQYANLDKKSRTMQFTTQWPAKLEGKITLESKSGATDPTKGGFSFKLSPGMPKTTIEKPNEGGSDLEAQDQEDFEKAAAKIAKGTVSKTTTKKTGDVGRAKRK